MQTEVFLSLTTQGRAPQTDDMPAALRPGAPDFAAAFSSLAAEADLPVPVPDRAAPEADPEPEETSDAPAHTDDSDTGGLDPRNSDSSEHTSEGPAAPVLTDGRQGATATARTDRHAGDSLPETQGRDPAPDHDAWTPEAMTDEEASGVGETWRTGPTRRDHIAELAWTTFAGTPRTGSHIGRVPAPLLRAASARVPTHAMPEPSRPPAPEGKLSQPVSERMARLSSGFDLDLAPPHVPERPGNRVLDGRLAHARTTDTALQTEAGRPQAATGASLPPVPAAPAEAPPRADVQDQTVLATKPSITQEPLDSGPPVPVKARSVTASASVGTIPMQERGAAMSPAGPDAPGLEPAPRRADRNDESRTVVPEPDRPPMAPAAQRRPTAATVSFPAEQPPEPQRPRAPWPVPSSSAPGGKTHNHDRIAPVDAGRPGARLTGDPGMRVPPAQPPAASLPQHPAQRPGSEADQPVSRRQREVPLQALIPPAAPSPRGAPVHETPVLVSALERDSRGPAQDAPAPRKASDPMTLRSLPAQTAQPAPAVVSPTAEPAARTASPIQIVPEAPGPALMSEPLAPLPRDTAAVPTGLPTSPAQQATLAREVAQQLSSVTRTMAGDVTELTLRPEELGQVRMRFSGSDGQIVLQILSERPETHDLMRRHIDIVERAFRDLGYSDIAFDFGTPGQQGRPSQDNDGAPQEAQPDDLGAAPHPTRPQPQAAGRLDIRL